MGEVKYHFEKLTPIDDVDLKVYEDAFDFVFDNADIRNVAVSGAYSSGKSSILESYKKKHEKLKFLHISLAHFRSTDDQATENENVKESVLEGKIINQLIHQIPTNRIPQTNFKVKGKTKKKTVDVINASLFSALILVILYFNFHDVWENYVLSLRDGIVRTGLSFLNWQYTPAIAIAIFIAILWVLIFKIIRMQRTRNVFRKLNIQGNEIELFEDSEDSVFDKYLNEILYLFENAKVDAVVFEDIDRFGNDMIFERLREINTLVNGRRHNKKRPIRFLYLLRDDIFLSKDRTKFFDYIIPVVPVLDSSNSYDQFRMILEKEDILKHFDDHFLQGLSLYVDDMRLLKNIYNEFVVYYSQINSIELDYNKMLALITYKNLFPRDFSELQLNKGFVYTLFNKKDEFIAEEIRIIDDEISKKQVEMQQAKNECLHSVKELNAVFAVKYFKNRHLGSDGEIEKMLLNYFNSKQREEYDQRKMYIENKTTDGILKLEKQIGGLVKRKNTIQNLKLQKIINRSNTDIIFSISYSDGIGGVRKFEEIKSSDYFDLLKYLIREGYIDETYNDYMTYFYENSLTTTDKIFLRSIYDQRRKEYAYKLSDPKLVVSKLNISDFDQEEVLNFSLFTYLVMSSGKEEDLKIGRLIQQLKDTGNFMFLNDFFEMHGELSVFVNRINKLWPEMLATAIIENKFSETNILKYSVFSLCNSDEETLCLMNQNHVISDYIASCSNYLANQYKVDIEKITSGLRVIDVKFQKIDYDHADKQLFNRVYEESLYEINCNNIQLMMKEMLGIDDDEKILHSNFTTLNSERNSSITQYIETNISQYVDMMLQMADGRIEDEESSAISLLNNEDVSNEQKEKYIKSLMTIISKITQIQDRSLWNLLLDDNVAAYTVNNIHDYYVWQNIEVLDDTLVAFINGNDIGIDWSFSEISSENKEKLFESLYKCNDINDAKYQKLLLSFGLEIKTLNVSGIAYEKMDILIKNRILQMNGDNLRFIRKEYPDHLRRFVEENSQQYADVVINDNLFLYNELIELLDWNVSDEIRLILLSLTEREVSIINKHYSDTVNLYILEHNLDENDLPKLYQSYSEWGETIKNKIYQLAIENIEEVLDIPKNVSFQLKDKLLHSDSLDIDSRVSLLAAMIPDLSEEYVSNILKGWGLNNIAKIFENRSRPKIEINPTNKKLLEAFKANGVIQNYEGDYTKDGFYKITKKTVKK